LVVLTYYFYPEFWFIPLFYLFFIMIKRVIEHFNSKYLISDEFIQMQTGSFSSELSILKKRNIDSLALNESWIERKFEVSTLKALISSKTVHTRIIIHLPKTIAINTYDSYAATEKIK